MENVRLSLAVNNHSRLHHVRQFIQQRLTLVVMVYRVVAPDAVPEQPIVAVGIPFCELHSYRQLVKAERNVGFVRPDAPIEIATLAHLNCYTMSVDFSVTRISRIRFTCCSHDIDYFERISNKLSPMASLLGPQGVFLMMMGGKDIPL